MRATVAGGGLAGPEAAWQLARRGVPVDLLEMRPLDMTPAHHGDKLGELVCSNSLRSGDLTNGAGLLKEELRRLGSLIMEAADATRVPAGGALAVDREAFSSYITEKITTHPLIRVIRQRVDRIPSGDLVVIATGPLTDSRLAEDIRQHLGTGYLHFFDAAAPLVTGESINMDLAWWGSRYGRGTPDYINCPLDRQQYETLVEFLVSAEKHKPDIEGEETYFEGCMPVEEMARRGPMTLAFGPLKPVGLTDPRTGREPFAAVQLRIDNASRSLFNLVGFQTSLTWGEQKKMMQLIPGLEEAEVVRYGVMHRNSYLCSPRVLEADGSCRDNRMLFFAGQLTGVEGYIESTASGLVAGVAGAARLLENRTIVFPEETATGALMHYITTASPDSFQPVNINWGLLPPLTERVRAKKLRNEKLASRALEALENMLSRDSLLRG